MRKLFQSPSLSEFGFSLLTVFLALIVGGLATVSAPEAALPVPPLVELTGPELFV